MSLQFTSDARPPSNVTLLPNSLIRPAFGELYGFDADADTGGGGAFSNGFSVQLDGTDDILTLDSTESFSGEFTFSTWINLSSLSNIRVWFGAISGGFTYMFYLSGIVYFRTAHGQLTLSQSVSWSTGEWHHVMVTRNSSNLVTMFIDGSSVQTGTNSDTLTLNSFGETTYAFDGLIDEYAVWDSDQSANISSIYNSGVPNDISSYFPLGFWRMGDNDGGTGTTITDQGVTYDPSANGGSGGYVSSGNDGTLANGPTFSTDVPS